MTLRFARVEIDGLLGILQCPLDLDIAVLADLEEGALPMDEREPGKNTGSIRVELSGELEQALSFDVALGRELVHEPGCAMVRAPGVEVRGMSQQRALPLRLLDLALDRTDDDVGDLILDVEDVIDIAVEVLGPDFARRDRVR